MVLLTTAGDQPADWVRAGQALESVLRAAFHTQTLEYPLLREFIRRELCGGEQPQVILRLGYPIGTSPAVRRPLVEVLT